MPDSSLSIDYTINSITNGSDGFTTIVWALTHDGTATTENRTGDKFKTIDIANGVSTDDDNTEKITKLKYNFELIARPYFQAFAQRIRLIQSRADIALLDDVTDTVEGLSVNIISGTVVLD
jgi:hypothetical protein